MVKKFSLINRETGPWSNYESFLMKDENIHVGWMEWTSNNTFRLNKNPLIKNPQSPYIYVIPQEVNIPINEGLIRVNPEKIKKDVEIPNKKMYGTYSNKFCIVDKYEPVDINKLPKPYISKDEFLYKITDNWVGDVQKQFSKEIAINILSCPKSNYGIGGIGAQSLCPYGGKQELIFLNSSLKNILPNDFLNKNKKYMYKPIKTERDLRFANSDINKNIADEISYNYLYTPSPQSKLYLIPTQIPLIIPEVFYKPDRWGLDRDVLDYQLSALLLNPYIEENTQKNLINIITKTAQDILMKSNIQALLDNTGVIRLAKAWCRLEYKQKIDENDFIRMKNDFQGIFKEYYDMIEDTDTSGRTYNIPLTRTFDAMRLSIIANKIYRYMKQIQRTQGYKKISKEIIRNELPVKEISNYDLNKGLRDLVNAGFLLTYKNYSEFELVNK
ncbi:hypothetical protein ACFL1L_00940 [Thermoplasmatota archaeon]